jgi:hypothetical protein
MSLYREFLLEVGVQDTQITLEMENKLKFMMSRREVAKPLVNRDKKNLTLQQLATRYRFSRNIIKRMVYYTGQSNV